MIYIVHNVWPIAAAALAAWAFGAAWFALLPARDRDARASLAGQLLVLASLFWIAAILAGALILAPVEAGGWTVALGTAAIIWGGFVFPVAIADTALHHKQWSTMVSRAGYWLGAMLLMAAILQTIGLQRPDDEAMAAANPMAPAGTGMAGDSAVLPYGEFRLAGVDDSEVDLGHAITISIDEAMIAVASQCVTPRWRYQLVDGVLSTQIVPEPICERGRYAAEDAVIAVFTTPETVARTPQNGWKVSGGGHSITLFSQ